MSEQISNPAPAVPAVFQFEGHEIRMIEQDGEALFNVNDLCAALTFKNPSQAIATHVDTEDLQKLETPTNSGIQLTNYVNESGMHSLVLGSTKPEAKRFKRWVTKDVLPSIRKHGHYSVAPVANSATLPAVSTDPLQLFLITADAVKHLAEKTVQLESRTAQVEDIALDTAGKFDDFLDSQPMRPHQCHAIQKAVGEKVQQLSEKHNLAYRPVIFSAIYGFLKRHFQVNTYSAIAARRFDEALAVVKNLVLEQLPDKVANLPKRKEVMA